MNILIKKDGQVVETKHYRKQKVAERFVIWMKRNIANHPKTYVGWTIEDE